MKLFKKSLALVPVRDVKQHLIDEFRRSNELANQVKEKDKEIEKLEKYKDELNKSYIVLEQFKFRHGKQEEEISNLKDKIKFLKEEVKVEKEKANNSIIKMMTNQKETDLIKKENASLKRELKKLNSKSNSVNKTK